MKKKPPGKRSLSDEEKKLWEFVTRNATKLRPEEEADLEEAEDSTPAEEVPAVFIPIPATLPHRKDHKTHDDSALSAGAYAGIDRNTAERLRKGKLPIDGRLDLHGFTREEAQRLLDRFIISHAERESRCLLVITGKGVRKDVQATPERGILREMLPVWLASPALRRFVLAFDVAQPKHGGTGAFYVLLRRKR